MAQCGSGCSSNCGSNNLEVKTARRNIKNVVAIMSGKGGVGKSTVTSILAKELKKLGYSVGIMDADITGPSIPRLMGIKDERALSDGEYIYPVITKEGIKVISLNLVINDETEPVVWMGPVVANAIKQFWNEVVWEDLDFLLIDMPPGTGDVPLTVMKTFDIKGVVMVSIPQDMVSMIVKKAINMAKKMNVPVLGLIENMSYIPCDECGHRIHIADEEETKHFLNDSDVELLGELPMKRQIAAFSSGKDEYHDEIFTKIAEKLVKKIEGNR